MNKVEAKWNTVLNQYLRVNPLYCYYELKQTSTNSFQFAKIEKVQKEGLPALEKNGLVWKMSDADPREKPMDGLCTPPLPAYLVIKFNDGFYFIRYKVIERLKEEKRVGITKEMAQELAEKIVRL